MTHLFPDSCPFAFIILSSLLSGVYCPSFASLFVSFVSRTFQVCFCTSESHSIMAYSYSGSCYSRTACMIAQTFIVCPNGQLEFTVSK
ncbi:hypothetical protein CISIN_1g037915mg [Citrus sinensis]|uniref:Uncharacterized protein n=1 Tax=Citrus sinensis TaxID=2711 RepID=A0A067GHU1_CITSI|nr:hypothetical protein CISIN_1g037915mg [Citrus sinensis]